MVLIPLKSQYVSLIITFLSFLSEMLILSSLLIVNNYRVCIALKRGHDVNVRKHRRWTQSIAVGAGALFFILEVIISFFSDPAILKRIGPQKCISLDAVSKLSEPQDNYPETDVLENKCLMTRNKMILQRPGNISLKNDQVQCDNNAVYKFRIRQESEVFQVNQVRTQNECGIFNKSGNPFCVFVFQNKTKVFYSTHVPLDVRDGLLNGSISQGIPFMGTEILFNTKGLLNVFAARMVETYKKDVSDPVEQRRRIFLGSKRQICPFVEKRIDATLIPLFLVCILSVLWLASVLVYAIVKIVSTRKIFYNLGDPLHWAMYTHRHGDEEVMRDPVVKCATEGDRRFIYVSDANPQRAMATPFTTDSFLDDKY